MAPWLTPSKKETLMLRSEHARLVLEEESHRQMTVRMDGFAQALDVAENGGASVMSIEQIRTYLGLGRFRRSA